ncbi:MAG: hypothetical protein HY507_02025 [Candidatus Zambryskibacteria bacterium]|nr:hypothetical protein [Candidatus Zambryskibacteria bacterium]
MTVLIGLGFAILGQVLTTVIHSDWKYLFYTLTPGGLMIAVFFTICGVANFVGTCFVVKKEFTRWLPSQLIVIATIVAVVLFFPAVFLGVESQLGVALIFISAGSLVLSVPVAFFIRGMAPPTPNDH